MTTRYLLRFVLLAAAVAPALAGPQSVALAQVERSDSRIGTTTVAELQRLVDEARALSGAAGVQVSVIKGDQRADLVSGTANVELGMPMTVETVIQIGSTTKVMNAALIMTLVDEGRVSLARPVKDYIPNLDLADDASERTITLRQLLSMSSGLDNGPYTDHGGGDDGLARYVASLATAPQAFRPGAGWGYSNAGTSIAGYAAERVMGETWDVLLKRRIFDPAGLTHAVTRARDLPFQRVSAGHTPGLEGQRPAVVRPWYITQAQGPAGSTLAMSAQDVASFGQIFLRKGRAANGTRVLSEASVTAMMTPIVKVVARSYIGGRWCIGFEREDWGGTPVFGHAGGNQSGTSYLKVFPERDGVLAITVNTPAALGVFASKIFDEVGPTVFQATRPKPAPPRTGIGIGNPERYVGTYEMIGSTYDVTFDSNQLSMHVTTAADARRSASTTRYSLIPLGGDAFLMEREAGHDGPPGELGFFGDDGSGRATNLTAPVFPARRVK